MAEPKIITNEIFRAKVAKSVGRPVLTMLELPMSANEQKAVAALNLKEGDILHMGEVSEVGGIHAEFTWFCSVSVPPDCDAGIDGGS